MKKIVTTVGTSIFTNLFEEINAEDLKRAHNALKDGFPHSRWDEKDVQKKCEKLRSEVKKFGNSDHASAEISSLLKIKTRYHDEPLEVYLIATDTVLSRLAAELVRERLAERLSIHFDPDRHVINGLSIEQAGTFIEKGIQGLVQSILDIKGEDENSMLLNISGGYKGLIPVMTIIGQLYGMNLCYTYEDSEELIEIPRMPLNFDWEVIEQYSTPLLRPKEMTEEQAEDLRSLHLVIKKDDRYDLSLLGTLLAQYLDRNPPHFGTQFGYFIEYKLKEYYDEELGCQRVIHGYKPSKNDKSAPQGDVDLALLDDEGGFTAIEFKPFEVLSSPDKLSDFIDKLIVRAKALGIQQELAPKEICLFTYTLQVHKEEPNQPMLVEAQRNMLEEIAAKVQEEIPGAKFHCKNVLVLRNKVTPGDRIPYKKFLGTSIKSDQIETIFPVKQQ